MEINFDVAAMGELLIDFTQTGISPGGNPVFERNPGGAPANVLAALSNYGKKTAFIGKVGKDLFGDYLKSVLEEHGINTSGLLQTSEYNTTLAFVQLDASGDRSFSFYRNPGADLMLYSFEVRKEVIAQSKVFHFGSVSLTDDPCREATFAAAAYAKEQGKVVTYDPNLRIHLWTSPEDARKYILEGMQFADVVKVSEEELEFLMDTQDLSEGSSRLVQEHNIQLLVATKGAEGAYYRYGELENSLPALKIQTIDTTGAGDAFTAGLINQLLAFQLDLPALTKQQLDQCVRFGIVSGSLSTRKKGAIPSMPLLSEVEEILNGMQKERTMGDT